MKTITVNLYQFSELSDSAKENARNWLREWYPDYGWWENTYEDANNIGLKITGFDIDRPNYCNGELTNDSHYTANKIKTEHGEECDTYKLAVKFLANWDALVAKYSDGDGEKVTEGNEDDFDTEADELESDFKDDLLEEYLSILKNEYEYLTSDECIDETIIANEYDFTENGERA